MHILKAFFMLVAASLLFIPMCVAEEEKLIARNLLDGYHFAILRHATAPGTGDPQDFVLGDCTTQRNLSEEGRSQALKIGARLRSHGVESARVFSSQWCRCLETARLLGLGKVQELPALNSFFRYFERKEKQTGELRGWIDRQDLGTPLVLVSHQVNITALTGVFPGSGEMVVVERKDDGSLEVAGTVRTQ